jgi:hypothetical protein
MAYKQWMLMLAIPVLAIGLWLILPHTAVTVAVLMLVVLVAVFGSVYRLLSSSRLSESPDTPARTPPRTRP